MVSVDIGVHVLPWHMKNSDAVKEILLRPLESQGLVLHVSASGSHDDDCPSSLWVDRAPSGSELERRSRRVIWAPMFSRGIQKHDLWRSRFPNLRVIAFTDAIAQLAARAGHECLRVKYYPANPGFCASWENGRTLFYWNRMRLVNERFLEDLCSRLEVDTLIYRDKPDGAQYRRAALTLPHKLGATVVKAIEATDRGQYMQQLSGATLYLAPRPWEGVGLAALEAMAAGMATFGVDAPALNDYIRHEQNGFLFAHPGSARVAGVAVGRRIRNRLADFGLDTGHPAWLPRNAIPRSVGTVDVTSIGRQAAVDMAAGRRAWMASADRLAAFMFNDLT